MNDSIKTKDKILPVIRVLLGTAAKKYPWFFVFESVKTLINVIQPFVSLIILPMIVDEVCGDRDIRKLVIYAAAFVLIDCLLGIGVEAVSTKLSKYQERLDNFFSMELGKHSMRLDFQLTEDKQALDQLDKAKTGMMWYSGGAYGVAEQAFMFVGNILKIVGFVTVMVLHAPLLILVICITAPINAYINSKVNDVALKTFGKLAKTNRLFGYFGWNIVDFRYGKDIRLYEGRDMIVNHWEKNTDENLAGWKWQGDMSFKYHKGTAVINAFMNVAIFLYTGLLAIEEIISIGTFTKLIEATGGLNSTIGGLIWNVQELLKRCNYAYEYIIFMEYPEAIEKGHDSVERKNHTIEFRDVCFAYPGTDRLILDHINITIEPGEKLSIVGLNGAGKTTFIKLLCRLYDPTSGQILLDGKDIKEYDYDEYMQQFAPVFQDFKLFGFTIGENIIGDEVSKQSFAIREKIKELTGLVELDELIDKNEGGIDTTVFTIFDEKGVEPSGGEQQKIAIARAIYKDAPVIILDEPTAALDPVTEYAIYRQFHTLVGNKTAFYISHRLSSCRFCDKIAVFADGQIKEYGNHGELIRIEGGIYAGMFEAQAQYYR